MAVIAVARTTGKCSAILDSKIKMATTFKRHGGGQDDGLATVVNPFRVPSGIAIRRMGPLDLSSCRQPAMGIAVGQLRVAVDQNHNGVGSYFARQDS